MLRALQIRMDQQVYTLFLFLPLLLRLSCLLALLGGDLSGFSLEGLDLISVFLVLYK